MTNKSCIYTNQWGKYINMHLYRIIMYNNNLIIDKNHTNQHDYTYIFGVNKIIVVTNHKNSTEFFFKVVNAQVNMYTSKEKIWRNVNFRLKIYQISSHYIRLCVVKFEIGFMIEIPQCRSIFNGLWPFSTNFVSRFNLEKMTPGQFKSKNQDS